VNTPLTDLNRMQAQQSYLDLNSLQSLKQVGREDQDEALKQIAKQFESLFMQMVMKSMRSANKVFEKDNPFNSSEMDFHRDMLDNQLSLHLTGDNGSGLADVLYRQLKQGYQHSNAIPSPSTDAITRGSETIDSIYNTPRPLKSLNEQALFDNINSAQEFVEKITPYAKSAADELGIDYRVIVAQSALETGWGKHVIKDTQGTNSFNFFNIKANKHWSGESVAVSTLEYRNGIAAKEQAHFRRYNTVDDSFSDYTQLLQQPRYAQALSIVDDPEQFVHELQKAGYATDPNYADKIIQIMNNNIVHNNPERAP